jgi:hypothetical protein
VWHWPDDEIAEGRFVQLACFSNSIEAGMVHQLLCNNQIRAVLQGANFGSLEPLPMPGGFSEIKLLVPQGQLEQATALYQAFFEESEWEELRDGEDPSFADSCEWEKTDG